MPTAMSLETTTHRSNGARLAAADGRALPLKSAAVRGRAGGGLARVTLEQHFANPYAEPLHLTYQMPLPADGAVSGYTIHIGDRVLHGEIDKRAAARRRFEQALVEGKTAGLLDQDRTALFTQEIGNVPAGCEVRVEISVDQRLAWLADGSWEWRFPTVVAPRYMGAEGRVDDAAKVTVDVSDGKLPVRCSLELAIDDRPAEGCRVESPSHTLKPAAAAGPEAAALVALSGEGAALDRDLVVRWSVTAPETGVTLRRARPAAGASRAGSAYGLVTIVPPAAPSRVLPRDLTLLIDTSGSMSGDPLDQAKRIASVVIDSLGSADRFEVIAFGFRPKPWRSGPVEATPAARLEAIAWVGRLRASGGTEMLSAVQEALRPLREGAQKQVVLVTDGLVGFENEIVRSIRDTLPAGSRFHVAGVGSAVNRSLSAAAARAGRGREILAGLGEEAERCAGRLVAATRAPVVTNLVIEGSAVTGCAPRACPDLFAGSPVLAGVQLQPEGGDLLVRGRTLDGTWERRLAVDPTAPGEGLPTVAALYARELVEDLDMDLASGVRRSEIEARIEKIGLDFGIATRMTSWVAVSERQDVDPRDPSRMERIPQELPYGMSAMGLGLAASMPRAGFAMMALDRRSLAALPEELASLAKAQLPPTAVTRARLGGDHVADQRPTYGVFRRIAQSLGFTRPAQFPEPRRKELPARWTGKAAEGVWFLEFEVTGDPMDWEPRAPVLIRDESGREREVDIDRETSTRPGRIEPGRIVRLAVRIDGEAKSRTRALLVNAGNETLVLIVAPLAVTRRAGRA